MTRQNRTDPRPADALQGGLSPAADHPYPGGVVVEPPAAAEPAAKPRKAGRQDSELALMARIARALDKLTPDAQERVGAYLASRFKPKAT